MINQANLAAGSPILLGLSLQEEEGGLVEAAADLAALWKSPLILAHVIRPIMSYLGAGDIVVNPYYGFDRILNDQEEENAKAQLASYERAVAARVQVSSLFVRDYPAEGLQTLAQETRAQLLMVGVNLKQEKGLFSGFSTAFTLCQHAELPVLVFPLGSRQALSRELRILVADNLEHQGQNALEAALTFAERCHSTSLLHSYVYPVSEAEMQGLVTSIEAAMISGQLPQNHEFSLASYREDLKNTFLRDLQYRYRHSLGTRQGLSQYRAQVAFGKPAEQIFHLAEVDGTQLMVFGRHQLFHRKGLSFGKIPYEAMMKKGLLTLVVPEQQVRTHSV